VLKFAPARRAQRGPIAVRPAAVGRRRAVLHGPARSLSLSILLYSNDSVVMPVVIYQLYDTGAYPALAAFSMLQTVMVFAAIYGAKKIGPAGELHALRRRRRRAGRHVRASGNRQGPAETAGPAPA
jgi:hypothetical protein